VYFRVPENFLLRVFMGQLHRDTLLPDESWCWYAATVDWPLTDG